MFIAIVAIFLIMKIPLEQVMIHLIRALKNLSNVLSLINFKIYAPPLNEFSFAIYIILFIFIPICSFDTSIFATLSKLSLINHSSLEKICFKSG